MPPKQSILRLLERSITHARSESNHEQHLRELNGISPEPGGWSTVGNFDIELDKIPVEYHEQLRSGHLIGSRGAFGVVKRVVVRGVPLVQTTIMSNTDDIDQIKRETPLGKTVDGHEHIVKLIGIYQSTSHGNSFRHILTLPVAVRDLEQLLEDFEALRNTGKGYT